MPGASLLPHPAETDFLLSPQRGCTDATFSESNDAEIKLENISLNFSVPMRYFAASNAGPMILSEGSIRFTAGISSTFFARLSLNRSKSNARLYASFSFEYVMLPNTISNKQI